MAPAMACGLPPPPPPPDPMARVTAASRGQGEASGVGAGRQRGWRREAAAQLVREEAAQWGTREGRRDVSHSDAAWCCAALVLLPPFSSARARVRQPEKKRKCENAAKPQSGIAANARGLKVTFGRIPFKKWHCSEARFFE